MSTTQIKRLFQSGKEFVPITLAEAVVVNTSNIAGLTSLGITTLDKVLRTTMGIVGVNSTDISTLKTTVLNINTALEGKQDKLTAGAGITISNTGVISVTNDVELYKIVNSLPNPSEEVTNVVYLVPTQGGAGNNLFSEYLCILVSGSTYRWEKLGEIQTEVDLSGYVTEDVFNAAMASTISAKDVTLSNGTTKVLVDYTIPENLYDSMVNTDTGDEVIGS